MDALLQPTLSLGAQAFLRTVYGVLLLLTLLQALPQAPRFFLTATLGGYLDPSPLRDRLFRRATPPLLLAVWIASACALILNVATPLAALVNFALCYWFFVHTRWSGILRGMGAPGFLAWWLSACVLLLELALHHDETGTLRPWVVLAFRTDFAVIMLCSGIYKASAGYRQSDGMELGLTNPWWGYWWRWFSRMSADHVLFKVFNTLAYVVQISAGILMLIPSTSEVGALAIALSFAGIAIQIRLGFLCEMVILAALVHTLEGGRLDALFAGWASVPAPAHELPGVPHLTELVKLGTITYLVLLPFAKAGLYANFYFKRRLPSPLQWALERWTNLFGLIVWRVFTVDVVCFFAELSVKDPASGERRSARPGLRYRHVGEFICLASIFTTLKYHASNRQLFEDKLVRYARTIPCPEGWLVHFDYKVIRKDGPRGFRFESVAELEVDPHTRVVTQRSLDPSFSLSAAGAFSPVHEGERPGSYAPKAQMRRP